MHPTVICTTAMCHHYINLICIWYNEITCVGGNSTHVGLSWWHITPLIAAHLVSVSYKVLQSREGTTQADPLAMTVYGLAILPLMEKGSDDNLIQKWYAEDGNAAGSVEALKVLPSKLKLHGPSFDCNVINSHLITKAEFVNDAIIDDSCRQNIKDQKQNYLGMLQKLVKHAKSEPQNAYKCLTNSVQQKLTFY